MSDNEERVVEMKFLITYTGSAADGESLFDAACELLYARLPKEHAQNMVGTMSNSTQEEFERELDESLACNCRIEGVADLTCPTHGVYGSAPFSDGQD